MHCCRSTTQLGTSGQFCKVTWWSTTRAATIEAISLKVVQVVKFHVTEPVYSIATTTSTAKLVLPDSKVASKLNRTIPFQFTIPESTHRPSVLTGADCCVVVQHFLCATVKVSFAANFETLVPFFFTPKPSELEVASFAKPATPLIQPVSVNQRMTVPTIDGVQLSAPAPVLVGGVGTQTDKPKMK